MAGQKFGGKHTEQKLVSLEEYLRAYTTALRSQGFRLVFFDGFAGTGDIEVGSGGASLFSGEDYRPFIEGSAQRALRLKESFDEYVFVEKSSSKVSELEALKVQFAEISDRIRIICGDSNIELKRFCADQNWARTRAVVFLDPFGNQVEWNTIVEVANTKAIDLWYLFPAGLGVHRQISRGGTVDKTHEASLDSLMGAADWRTEFISSDVSPDLFEVSRTVPRKTATPDSITRFMIKRMKGVFEGGVLDQWLPLGSRGVHMYSLIFAWANPSPKAKLAGKLAAAVLRSRAVGRAK